MLVLVIVIGLTAAVSISQPKAVRAVGHGIVCAVSFGHAKSCHAPAPVAPAPDPAFNQPPGVPVVLEAK